MSITYSQEPIETITPMSGIVVLDMNIQGIAELTHSGKILKSMFPQTYKQYITRCAAGVAEGGDALFYVEDDFCVVVMYTQENITPRLKDDETMIEYCIDKCLVVLKEFLTKDDEIVMPIPLRNIPAMSRYMTARLRELNVPITFYNK